MAALATPTNSSKPPRMHRVSGRGRNVSDEGVKRAVSRRVWPPRRRGDSGTANIAAPKDSTTRAAKDGPVWLHCSALAVRYEGECGADSAHASHSENEPSMKGLTVRDWYLERHMAVHCLCSFISVHVHILVVFLHRFRWKFPTKFFVLAEWWDHSRRLKTAKIRPKRIRIM